MSKNKFASKPQSSLITLSKINKFILFFSTNLLMKKKIKDDKVHCFTKCQIDDFFSLPFTFLYSQKIWVNGCMTEARQTLFKHVMPLLLICALVSLVVGLIELLLLLCAVCFADHIKVRSLHFHSKLLIGSWVHNLGWSKIYSKF